jgi:hypothetical protein
MIDIYTDRWIDKDDRKMIISGLRWGPSPNDVFHLDLLMA